MTKLKKLYIPHYKYNSTYFEFSNQVSLNLKLLFGPNTIYHIIFWLHFAVQTDRDFSLTTFA